MVITSPLNGLKKKGLEPRIAKNTIIARDNFKKYEYSSTSLGDNQE